LKVLTTVWKCCELELRGISQRARNFPQMPESKFEDEIMASTAAEFRRSSEAITSLGILNGR